MRDRISTWFTSRASRRSSSLMASARSRTNELLANSSRSVAASSMVARGARRLWLMLRRNSRWSRFSRSSRAALPAACRYASTSSRTLPASSAITSRDAWSPSVQAPPPGSPISSSRSSRPRPMVAVARAGRIPDPAGSSGRTDSGPPAQPSVSPSAATSRHQGTPKMSMAAPASRFAASRGDALIGMAAVASRQRRSVASRRSRVRTRRSRPADRRAMSSPPPVAAEGGTRPSATAIRPSWTTPSRRRRMTERNTASRAATEPVNASRASTRSGREPAAACSAETRVARTRRSPPAPGPSGNRRLITSPVLTTASLVTVAATPASVTEASVVTVTEPSAPTIATANPVNAAMSAANRAPSGRANTMRPSSLSPAPRMRSSSTR